MSWDPSTIECLALPLGGGVLAAGRSATTVGEAVAVLLMNRSAGSSIEVIDRRPYRP